MDNAECDSLKDEVEALMLKIKHLMSEAQPNSSTTRSKRLEQWTKQWGGAPCTFSYKQTLKQLKQELEIKKKQLEFNIKQTDASNKFKRNHIKDYLWNKPELWDEPPSIQRPRMVDEPKKSFLNQEQLHSESDEALGEEDYMMGQERNYPSDYDEENISLLRKSIRPESPRISPSSQTSDSNATAISGVLNTFKTKAKALFGKGGKRRRKKTRRKGKK